MAKPVDFVLPQMQVHTFGAHSFEAVGPSMVVVVGTGAVDAPFSVVPHKSSSSKIYIKHGFGVRKD